MTFLTSARAVISDLIDTQDIPNSTVVTIKREPTTRATNTEGVLTTKFQGGTLTEVAASKNAIMQPTDGHLDHLPEGLREEVTHVLFITNTAFTYDKDETYYVTYNSQDYRVQWIEDLTTHYEIYLKVRPVD